jgi:hypothetical protein
MLSLVERQAYQPVRESPANEDGNELTPAHRVAAERVLASGRAANIVVLQAGLGSGRTTVLRAIAAAARGATVGAREFMSVLAGHQAAAIEKAFVSLMDAALDKHDIAL